MASTIKLWQLLLLKTLGVVTLATRVQDDVCHDIPPFVESLRWGIDAAAFTFFPRSEGRRLDFLRKTLFSFNCSHTKTWTDRNSEEYNQPNEVDSILQGSSGSLEWFEKEYENIYNVVTERSRAKQLGFDFGALASLALSYSGFNPGLSSVIDLSLSSASKQQSLNDQFRKCSSSVIEITANLTLYTAALQAHQITLKANVDAFLDKLDPVFEDDAVSYIDFIHKFGTHFFAKASFGGFLRYRTTSKNVLDKNSVSSSKQDASSWVLVNSETAARKSFEKISLLASTDGQLKNYGGQMKFDSENPDRSVEEWLKSLETNLWIITGDLMPISELIRDTERKASMEKASKIYLEKSYVLDELFSLLHHSTGAQVLNPKVDKSKMDELEKELIQFKHETMPDMERIRKLLEKITYQVIPPEWWSQVRLCFQYYADSPEGSFQCGPDINGDVGTMCANVNELTSEYNDSTRSYATAGCKMRWQIETPRNYDDWFRYTKLCFRYKSEPQYVNGQCGGHAREKFGGKGEFCARLNEYTEDYLDATDNREGGCYESWKIEVSDDAPFWMLNTRICLFWKQFGELHACQLDKKEEGKICAFANEWTEYYFESTREASGCKMQWVIADPWFVESKEDC